MGVTKSLQGISTLTASYYLAKSGRGCSNFCLRLPDGKLLSCVALDSERFPSAQYARDNVKPGLAVSVTGSSKDGEDVFFVNNIFVGDIKDHPVGKDNVAASFVKPRIGVGQDYRKQMLALGVIWADCGDFYAFKEEEECVLFEGKWYWWLWFCQQQLSDSYVFERYKDFRRKEAGALPSLSADSRRSGKTTKAVSTSRSYQEAYQAFKNELLAEARFE